jgi:hypothetical protein
LYTQRTKNGPHSVNRRSVSLTAFLLGFLGLPAVALDEPSLAAESSAIPCSLALPGSVTEALTCSDKIRTFKALDEGACVGSNSPAAIAIQQVWPHRDSLPADAAARDPWIQAFMANCIIEASHNPNLAAPLKATAVDYLRNALRDSSPSIVAVAMMGLSTVLEQEDIDPIAKQPNLAVSAVAALSISCSREAKARIVSIRAAYADTSKAAEIDQFVDESKDLCAGKVLQALPTFVGQVIPSPTAQHREFPSAAQVRSALSSEHPQSVRLQVLNARCSAARADVVGEMREAWEARNSPSSSATVRNPLIQTVIAKCLIYADYAANSANVEVTNAAGLLRTAIRSDDIMTAMVSMALCVINVECSAKPRLLQHQIAIFLWE